MFYLLVAGTSGAKDDSRQRRSPVFDAGGHDPRFKLATFWWLEFDTFTTRVGFHLVAVGGISTWTQRTNFFKTFGGQVSFRWRPSVRRLGPWLQLRRTNRGWEGRQEAARRFARERAQPAGAKAAWVNVRVMKPILLRPVECFLPDRSVPSAARHRGCGRTLRDRQCRSTAACFEN